MRFYNKKSKGAKKPLTPAQKNRNLADKWFSRYIRLKYTDDNGYVRCVTCGVPKRPNQLDNGHFIKRGNMSTRFCENNCFPQCTQCNYFKGGNDGKYAIYLIKRFGQEHVNELYRLEQQSVKISDMQYFAMLFKWKKDVKEMLVEKGIEKWW